MVTSFRGMTLCLTIKLRRPSIATANLLNEFKKFTNISRRVISNED